MCRIFRKKSKYFYKNNKNIKTLRQKLLQNLNSRKGTRGQILTNFFITLQKYLEFFRKILHIFIFQIISGKFLDILQIFSDKIFLGATTSQEPSYSKLLARQHPKYLGSSNPDWIRDKLPKKLRRKLLQNQVSREGLEPKFR